MIKISASLSRYIKEKIKGKSSNISATANDLNMSRTTLTSQLNGNREISIDQLHKLGKELRMSIYLVDDANQRTFKL